MLKEAQHILGEDAQAAAAPAVYRRMLADKGAVAAFVQGWSMRPLLRGGCCYVSVTPLEGEPVVGDILLFEQVRAGRRACILHRLVAVEGTVYVCRGDNCLQSERISRADIIGRADRLFWARGRRWLLPRLLGARRDARNGAYWLSATAPGHLRYVALWTWLWPVRRVCYAVRQRHLPSRLYARLARVGWLRRLYHRLKGQGEGPATHI